MNQVTYGSAAVLLSLAFIGSFETIFRNPNKTIKWVADSSYWIYIIHLPIVATLTFWFAHFDHNDWPIYIAGMSWNAEAKFVVASAVTTLIGMISYRYLVRYTFIGWLINGRKSKRQSSRHI
jgi:peptidoglycan/LPS O-acetylase OafA/YrhL